MLARIEFSAGPSQVRGPHSCQLPWRVQRWCSQQSRARGPARAPPEAVQVPMGGFGLREYRSKPRCFTGLRLVAVVCAASSEWSEYRSVSIVTSICSASIRPSVWREQSSAGCAASPLLSARIPSRGAEYGCRVPSRGCFTRICISIVTRSCSSSIVPAV